MAQKYCTTAILALQMGSPLQEAVWVDAEERGPGGRNAQREGRFDPGKLAAFLRPKGSAHTG